MDGDQLEGAGAEVEQILVHLESPALELALADGAQALLDRIHGAGAGGRFGGTQLRELGERRIEGAGQILLLEQMALNLAAGGLRDARDRYHSVELHPGVLGDAMRELSRQRQEG